MAVWKETLVFTLAGLALLPVPVPSRPVPCASSVPLCVCDPIYSPSPSPSPSLPPSLPPSLTDGVGSPLRCVEADEWCPVCRKMPLLGWNWAPHACLYSYVYASASLNDCLVDCQEPTTQDNRRFLRDCQAGAMEAIVLGI